MMNKEMFRDYVRLLAKENRQLRKEVEPLKRRNANLEKVLSQCVRVMYRNGVRRDQGTEASRVYSRAMDFIKE